MSAPEPKEIREQYDETKNSWREIYEEGKTDMRYVAGDPWDPADRKQREDNGRPCISCDELGQYLNQAINNIRQNKRAIKIIPKGSGADDKSSEVRASIIRGIEYESKAQSAYTCAFESAIQRSYGFWRITTSYSRDLWELTPTEKSFEQQLRIRRIANSDSVLISPNYKEADASDIDHAFILDKVSYRAHKREFGDKTKIVDFESVEGKEDEANEWMGAKQVQLAEFWQVDKKKRNLFMIQGPEGMPLVLWEEEIEAQGGMKGVQVLKQREMYKNVVTQWITNGLEILEENKWKGSSIPIVPCFGKELWIDRGSGAKRELMSMVRLARDPQMLHAYLNSQEAEEAGKAPQSPMVGYVGQFETDKEAWESAHSVPRAFLQIDVMTDGSSGTLPIPSQPQFVPNFAAYEVAKESARRAIQAAMGQTPLPTSAQRQNEKSGKALEKIQEQQSVGAFHFTDNFDMSLQNGGRKINELLDIIVGTQPRQLPAVNKKDEHQVINVNNPQFAQANPTEPHIMMGQGDYGETISTGPSYQSQRDQAGDFVDLLVSNLKTIPAPPEVLGKMLALAIKMKQLGPIGDELADLLDPQDPQSPERMKQAMMKTQEQLKQMDAAAQQFQAELQKLQQEKEAKVVDNQAKMQIEQFKAETQLAIAEITTKAQAAMTRAKLEYDLMSKMHVAAHDRAMQADSQQHEASENAAQEQHDSQMQAGQQGHEQDMQASQQDAAAQQQQETLAAAQQAQQTDIQAQQQSAE